MVRLIPRRKKPAKALLRNAVENAEANATRTHWFKKNHRPRQKIIKER